MRARPSPALELELDERFHSNLVQLLQVLDHAHAVLGAVALVDPPKARARIGGAGDTQRLGVLRKVLARLDGAHHRVPRLREVVRVIAAWTGLAAAKVRDAETAVHPTRGYQFRRQ